MFNAAGIDTVLQYRTGLGWFMARPDRECRVSWTHYLKGYMIPLPGADKDPLRGRNRHAEGQGQRHARVQHAQVGLSFTGTYIGKAYEDNVFLGGLRPRRSRCRSRSIRSSTWTRRRASRRSKNYEFFVGVDNVLDNKAPNILSGTTVQHYRLGHGRGGVRHLRPPLLRRRAPALLTRPSTRKLAAGEQFPAAFFLCSR